MPNSFNILPSAGLRELIASALEISRTIAANLKGQQNVSKRQKKKRREPAKRTWKNGVISFFGGARQGSFLNETNPKQCSPMVKSLKITIDFALFDSPKTSGSCHDPLEDGWFTFPFRGIILQLPSSAYKDLTLAPHFRGIAAWWQNICPVLLMVQKSGDHHLGCRKPWK